MFGEKDYQQLNVVTRLARVYLTPGERAIAPTLHRVLTLCAAKIAKGRPIATILSEDREAIARAGVTLDYLEARPAERCCR